ncbi:serine/threonine-protein kinase [Streptomyces sp. NRRL F-5123]|uniref:serine/threonine-protein kinase n=1 Tax=Streptomyces sp. NRRL F-5123 TaxID=1463856 RepID=UPI0005BD5A2B|nr:serine/threonine-protein kinase [Streptomyces sp. NRRL F-5123]
MVGPADQGRLVAGRYRLLERIGRGGMGTVWRAQDELLDRQVAVKKLHPPQPDMDDDELATLFERTRREARAAARISHPNVIVVHDVVDDAGLPSIVMEYVPSVTLGDLVKQHGPLAPGEAARIGRGMVAALIAAHQAGVLHRDVKPGNVLLGHPAGGPGRAHGEDTGSSTGTTGIGTTSGTGTGRVPLGSRIVLTDFGIAQSSGTSTLTRTGEIIGSIDFLSPERLRGAPPGPEADLWALGATLYQAVDGRSPFRRPTPIETAYAIAEETIEPPPAAGALTEVIAGLLAKEPAERLSAADAERMLRIPAAEPDTAYVARTGLTRTLPPPPTGSVQQVTTGGPQPGPRPDAGAEPPAYTGSAPPPHTPPRGAHHGPQHGSPPGPRRRRGRWIGAAVAVAVVAAGVAVAVDRAHRSDAASPDPTASPTATGTAAPTSDAPTQDPTTQPAPTTEAPTYEPPPVPDGYHLAEQADRGYKVPVPNGWHKKVYDGGDQVSYIDPTDTVALKISALDFAGLDPYQHWIDLEPQTKGQVKDYHRERMERTKTADGQEAALWQFTFQGTTKPFRALDLGFGKPGGREYAVYLSAPKDQWAHYRPVFETAVAGFRETG